MKNPITTSLFLAALAAAVPAVAQDPPAAAPAAVAPQAAPARPINMDEMRRHIYVMEGALAQAVDFGAKQLNRQILSVMPGVFMLEGEARARGVHLDGYGVFFDVRVPMMRQSMVWSLRMMMDQDDAANRARSTICASRCRASPIRAPARRWKKQSASSNGRPPAPLRAIRRSRQGS